MIYGVQRQQELWIAVTRAGNGGTAHAHSDVRKQRRDMPAACQLEGQAASGIGWN